MNLADEYVGKKVRFGQWKDTAIKVEGAAVDSFTLMFLQMWNATKAKTVNEYNKYIHKSVTEQNGSGFLMPYGTGRIKRKM